MFWARLALAACLIPAFAHAQSSPGFTTGQTLDAPQLNSAFQAKQDYPVTGLSSIGTTSTAGPGASSPNSLTTAFTPITSTAVVPGIYGQLVVNGPGTLPLPGHTIGVLGQMVNQLGTTLALGIGAEGRIDNSANVFNAAPHIAAAHGLNANMGSNTLGATIDNWYGVSSNINNNAGSIGTAHGFYVPTIASGASNTGTIGQFNAFENAEPTAFIVNQGFTVINRGLTHGALTFATRPFNIAGTTIYISDGATANCADGTCTTFGTIVNGGTGGAGLKLLIWYNGTNWTLIGK